ncbi:phosphate signaling complex PhoU family protein [Saccharopolyspora phatthalungensis]|uniref:Phosphate transport system protein n=1 Tax=Saccharopolyspora phatthalungensis TaxID=664693 RepID=A0A840QHW7_9PSEU|nr:PhoU domain-containing protein [Saccharopolyspora phatthalungensis]MBB5156903.1 phosphate transport system protein [Saccharopolyspora phatthalungensis]
MREEFYGELAQLADQLSNLSDMAAVAMRQATHAMLANDIVQAREVIAADINVDQAANECEEHAQSLLALQAPVATELRTILATLYCTSNIERMGDLAAHVASSVKFSHPKPAIPPELRGNFSELGQLTIGMAEHLRDLITGSAVGGFTELQRTDDTVDTLCADVLTTVTSQTWPHGVRMATNAALLVRFFERFADQAVDTARRLEFAATGILPR